MTIVIYTISEYKQIYGGTGHVVCNTNLIIHFTNQHSVHVMFYREAYLEWRA